MTPPYNVRPWLCHSCGVLQDAVTPLVGPRFAPRPGSVSICLNCSAVSVLRPDRRWTPMRTEEFHALDKEARQTLAACQRELADARRRFPAMPARATEGGHA